MNGKPLNEIEVATAPFPLIEVSGPPPERGRQYGRAAQRCIRRSLEIYRPVFETAGLEWREVRKIASEFMPRIERYSPAMLAELHGIAAGAEIAVEDVVARTRELN